MKRILCLAFLLTLQNWAIAQTPTVQDCLGAIPICQNQYSESTIHYGDGNYHSEINDNISCLDVEYYSVWYTFTAQTSGYFRFSITPNTYSNDYDWAVFNITNANCSEIFTNPSLCVSCNSYGDFDGSNGSTGANSNQGYGNSNGPGTDNGPPWNSDIPVTAGNTYAMLICNWSQSSSGYSLNFNGSTAAIFDNVPPHILPVNNPMCGDSAVLIQFSEYVMCNSVSLSDFKLIGPNNANIPLTSLYGQACASGGNQERYFKLRSNQSLQKGNYQLILCGSVNDLCGNTSVPDTLQFAVAGINFQTSSTAATCTPNGTATCGVINGQIPYNYHWSNGQTGSPINGLNPGTYSVTVTDHRGCVDSTAVVVPVGSGNIQIALEKHDLACFEDQSGWIKVNPISGQPPFVYTWSNGTAEYLAEHLSVGTYLVTVSDFYGCSTMDSISLVQNPKFSFLLDSTRNETCFYADGAIYTHAEGGVPPYQYQWNSSMAVNPYLENIHAGNYSIVAHDTAGCSQMLTINILGQPYPIANFSAVPPIAFLDRANIRFQNQSQDFSSSWWDFADGDFSDVQSPFHKYTTLGHYPVMLVVSSDNSCVDTVIKYVDIVEDFNIYIPNSFTPDSDGTNDLFGPVIQGGSNKDYRMVIYSRWGELLFSTHNINQFWNGSSLANAVCQNGVYVYYIEVTDLCNIRHEYVGNDSIIR